MNMNNKKTIQSGGLVTFFSGIFLNIIDAWGVPTEWNEVLVLLCTPLSLVITWGVLQIAKIVGSFTFEEWRYQRQLDKDRYRCRKVISDNGSTPSEKKEAREELNDIAKLSRKHSNERLKRLSTESHKSTNSLESIVVEYQDDNK
ncbi:MAG: hypothetical protein HRU25_07960 [Psychrobium sp.]|nr:hypothetical protein [Psychrobium sp.]